MTLKERSTGEKIWELRYYATDPKGVRVRRAAMVGTYEDYPTESAARRSPTALGLLLGANSETSHSKIAAPTVGAVIGRYEREELPDRYSTRIAYASMLKNHIRPRWSDTPLTDVKPMAVEDWLSSLKLASKTKAHIRGLFHSMLRCAQRWGLIEKNPIELVRVKGGSKRATKPVSISPEQFQLILDEVKQPYRTMVLVAGCLGLRVSEIMALQWGDFDAEGSTLLVQRSIVHGRVGEVKTEYSKDRMPVDPLLAGKLQEHRLSSAHTPEGWLFANPATGKPYHQEEIQKKHLSRAAKQAGLSVGIGWHTFRHSYRAWLDETGAPMGVQRELMRHASVTTTMNVYGAAMSDTKRAANGKIVRMLLETNESSDTAQASAAS